MAGDIEIGTCEVCNKPQVPLDRTYYRYNNIDCDCCGGESGHFEFVKTCKDCEPIPPRKISVIIKPD